MPLLSVLIDLTLWHDTCICISIETNIKNMKKLITIISITLVSLTVNAQSIIGYHIGNKNEMIGMFVYAKQHHLKLQKTESVNDMVLCYYTKAVTVVAGRQAVEAGTRRIVMTDSQINFLRSLNDKAINAQLDSHATIKFNTTADNIISLLDRQMRGNKAEYVKSFRNQSNSILAHL